MAADAAACTVSSLPSVLGTAPGQQPHDDEDDGRDQGGNDERLEHCGEPANGREDEPHGEDGAEDCPNYPAHVPIVRTRRPVAPVLRRLGSP